MDFWAFYTKTAEGVCPWVHRIVIEGFVLVFMCLVLFMQQARHNALVQREERLDNRMRVREEELNERKAKFHAEMNLKCLEVANIRFHADQELQQSKETNNLLKEESKQLNKELSKTERFLTIRSKEYQTLTTLVSLYHIRVEQIEQTMEDMCNTLMQAWDIAVGLEKQVLRNLFRLQNIKALIDHGFLRKIVHVKRPFEDTTQFSFRNRVAVKKQCIIDCDFPVVNPIETSLAMLSFSDTVDPSLGSLSLSDPNVYV